MRLYFKNNKEITNEEIIGFIKEYNPYYKEDKYIDYMIFLKFLFLILNE